MILKGLSKYDVTLKSREINVVSLHPRFKNRIMRYHDVKQTKYWYLVADDGKKYTTSEGKLRFLLSHPTVSFNDLDCRGNKISFRSSDGMVIPMGRTIGNRRFDVFRDYDDAIETILIMKRYSKGDVAQLYDFCESRKREAVTKVSRLKGICQQRVESAWEEALMLLDDKVRKFNVRRIIPLYALLCQQLRVAVEKRGRTLRITGHSHTDTSAII